MLNLVAHKRPEGHFITNQPRTKTIWETRHGKQKKRFNVCLENKIITRYGTNPPFQFPIWQLTSKETKRQAITKDQKKWNES